MSNTAISNSVRTNTSTVLSPSDIKRAEIIADANEEFIKVYDEITKKLEGEEKASIRLRYKIGEMVDELRLDEQTYGAKAGERMELVVGKDRGVIYQSLLFYARY